MDIAGCAAVVAGGASGLGAATARALAAGGARVAIIDQDGAGAATVAASFGGLGLGAAVQDDGAINEALDAAAHAHGAARVLVNCAGIARPGSTVRRDGAMPLDEFREVIEVNLTGTFNTLRLAALRMSGLAELADGERGIIVNTASIAAFEGQVGQAAYAASKGGVAAMTLPLARELARFGIRVVTIAPGVFRTAMTEGLPEKSREIVFGLKPPFPPRAGEPEEFARLVLAVIANPMINGTTIRLDGGLRAPPRSQAVH